jgi:hypothetical protein
MHRQPFRLLRFRNRIELELLLSLFVNRLRTAGSGQGSACAAPNGAPLTAPGRSEETISHKRERRLRKRNDPASNHLATSPARPRTRYYVSRYMHCGRGAGCRNFSRLPARREAFSLDILFYRTRRASLEGESEKADPNRRRRDVSDVPAQRVAPLERAAFRKYWPIWAVPAVPPSTTSARELVADKFGSAIRFRTDNLLVNAAHSDRR